MVIQLQGWGAYGLSIESLSEDDWSGGCGAIWGNDIPSKHELLHYIYRYILCYTQTDKKIKKKKLPLMENFVPSMTRVIPL